MYKLYNPDQKVLSFEWNEEKDAVNFQKHGIHFKTAAKVFFDPDKLIREDVEHPQEERYNIIGKVGKILFVVCVFKKHNVIRLISARLATRSEKERYKNDKNEY